MVITKPSTVSARSSQSRPTSSERRKAPEKPISSRARSRRPSRLSGRAATMACRSGTRTGRLAAAAVPRAPADPGHDEADGRFFGGRREAGGLVRLADGRDPARERRNLMGPREGRQVERDGLGRGRDRRRKLAFAAPVLEIPPVGPVGTQGILGPRLPRKFLGAVEEFGEKGGFPGLPGRKAPPAPRRRTPATSGGHPEFPSPGGRVRNVRHLAARGRRRRRSLPGSDPASRKAR